MRPLNCLLVCIKLKTISALCPMNAYITITALDNALKEGSDLKKILCSLSELLGTIYTDLPESELRARLQVEDDPLSLLLRNDIKIVAAPDELLGFRADTKRVLDDSNAIYVLNIKEEIARRIQSFYGVFCCSAQNVDVSFLTNGHVNKSTEFRPSYSWKEYFDDVERRFIDPINSIIISDRYLFADDTGKYDGSWSFSEGHGLKNCIAIIQALLPNSLMTEFSLLICIDASHFKTNSPNYGSQSDAYWAHFEFLSKTLDAQIKKMRKPYKIHFELLSINQADPLYYLTHNRRIVTNYAQIYTEQQYTAFKFDEVSGVSKPLVKQNITYNTLFSEGLSDNSDCPIWSHDAKLSEFARIFSTFNQPNRATTRLFSCYGQIRDKLYTKHHMISSVYKDRKRSKRG